MESVNLSFFKSALHTAHDLIHIIVAPLALQELDMLAVVQVATELSSNCQTERLSFNPFARFGSTVSFSEIGSKVGSSKNSYLGSKMALSCARSKLRDEDEVNIYCRTRNP
jgi:hypothetical protein